MKLFFFSAFVLVAFAFQQNEELIYWTPKKLIWSDFIGKHNDASTLDANTDYRITFTPSLSPAADSIFINVSCAFNKNRSSVRKGKANDSLLRHEQGHFDIAEIHARQFRKKISASLFTLKNMQTLLDAAYKSCVTNLQTEQDLYDTETDHSRDHIKQEFWLKKIATELKQNEIFSSSSLHFKINK